MIKFTIKFLFSILLLVSTNAFTQSESIVLSNLKWDTTSPASSTELFIPSGNSQIAGLIYSANGLQKHPTLLLLHGYPGNERNLDIAQVVRSHGWNVIYFDSFLLSLCQWILFQLMKLYYQNIRYRCP
jgi:predicted alpha/beta-fold hydrolase